MTSWNIPDPLGRDYDFSRKESEAESNESYAKRLNVSSPRRLENFRPTAMPSYPLKSLPDILSRGFFFPLGGMAANCLSKHAAVTM